jgi:hypothetical protein
MYPYAGQSRKAVQNGLQFNLQRNLKGSRAPLGTGLSTCSTALTCVWLLLVACIACVFVVFFFAHIVYWRPRTHT